ncbi:unnamed protein product [Chrysoparadoxa australica]
MAIKVMTFSGQWERALDIMAGLRAEARHPDLSGANSALAACMKANQWEKALELLQDMKDLGPQPNTLSFNNVIGACCRAGKPEEALMVIQQMKLSKGKLPRPDVVGLSTAVDALVRAEAWDQAFAIVNEMYGRGMVPRSRASCSSSIKACAMTGNWERAVSLLKQLQEAGNTPQAISYMDTISVCGSSGQWARAVALLEEMKEKGLKPNVGCYTDLIRASIEENELGKVKALLEEMMERGVQPNRELDRLVSHSSGDIDSYREWHEISNLVQTMRGGKATTASA